MLVTIVPFLLLTALLVSFCVVVCAPVRTTRPRIRIVTLAGNPEELEYRVRKILLREHWTNSGNNRLLLLDRGLDEDSLKICRLLQRKYPALKVCRMLTGRKCAHSCETV